MTSSDPSNGPADLHSHIKIQLTVGALPEELEGFDEEARTTAATGIAPMERPWPSIGRRSTAPGQSSKACSSKLMTLSVPLRFPLGLPDWPFLNWVWRGGLP